MKPSFKKPTVPEQETPVWICNQGGGDCKGWIRENFALEEIPKCPLCGSSIVRGNKLLPVLNNEPKEQKSDTSWRRRRGVL